MSSAIAIENVSKAYRLGTISSGTLGADLSRWWAGVRGLPDPSLRVGEPHERRAGQVFWALEQVSFDVAQGDVIGIIGRNGAGKSTLLKILSQVTAPTTGSISMRGRLASLLEVGTGFHPELTGRENIYLNGAILGMTKAEIRKNFDEIVAFSECETFIDTPVKRYSSGMYVRLAFAVAAHLEPEILIVDEVLAVGDVAFQQKCLGKMQDVSRHGRTILFVSHNLAAVTTLCNRAVVLRDGKVVFDGSTDGALQAYRLDSPVLDASEIDLGRAVHRGTGKARFTTLRVTAQGEDGTLLPVPVTGCQLTFEVDIDAEADFVGALVAIVVFDANRYRVIDVNTALRGDFVSLSRGERATITFTLADVLLKPGLYDVQLWMGRGAIEEIDNVEDAGRWEMHDPPAAIKHTQTFPGVYQCRFTHRVSVAQAPAVPALHGR